MNHQPKLSGIAAALADHGRNGDTELLHVSKSEIAALQAAGAPHGIRLTKNPETGLYEAFNWMGTVGGIAGGIIGGVLSAGNPMGVAAGAALGSGLGTAAGGGTTQQILTSAVISGVGGYVGGGGLSDLASAGESEIAKQTLEKTAETGLANATENVATDATGNALIQSADKFANVPQADYLKTVQSGLDKGLTNAQVNANLTGQNASYVDKLAEGWKAAPGMLGGQGANIAKVGVAALGVGSINPSSSEIVTPQTTPAKSTANPYKGEVYYTADGQKRTRAVLAARGGLMYGDYDGVEEAKPEDGYMTGGTTYMASGGSAASSAPPALSASDKNPPNTVYRGGGFDVYAEDLRTPITSGNRAIPTDKVLAKGFFTKEDYARATPEERAEMDRLMQANREVVPSSTRKQYPGGFAKGGEADWEPSEKENKFLKKLEVNAMPFVDKGVIGAGGRMGYSSNVGDSGHIRAGISGMGTRTSFEGTDPNTRGRVTGADLAYSPAPGKTVSARYDAMAPTVMPSNFGPIDAQNMMLMGPAPMAKDRFSVSYRQEFAGGGGIGDLGGYSDGGRLLKGPGDGVSDSIPADIEGKKPARLADGEFVIPARAVSELGNGSTEAGSKQLYKMLDRIAAKRKTGRGLAYEADPKKLMPA